MKQTAKKLFAALLAALLLLSAVSCDKGGNVTDTTAGGDTTAEGATNDTTAVESETEEVTLPAPEDYEITEKDGTASVTTPLGLTLRGPLFLGPRLQPQARPCWCPRGPMNDQETRGS